MNEPEIPAISEASTDIIRVESNTPTTGGVTGRGFLPGVSGNPGGKPRDPFARLIRERTKDGLELVEFALAVLRDDLTGRVAAQVGVLEVFEGDLAALEIKYKRAKEADDVMATATLAGQVKDLKAQIVKLKKSQNTKRKIPVAVKSRLAALVWLGERGWGRAVERVDLKLGGDGTPIGGAAPGAPDQGVLLKLTESDLAKIGVVLEDASKRPEIVESSAVPVGTAEG
jgi:hypothetical protein